MKISPVSSRHHARWVTGLLIATLTACGADKGPSTPTGAPVRTAKSSSGPAAPSIEASGLLGRQDEVRLSFKTGGIIRSLPIKEGTRVRRGEVLAALELDEVDAQFTQARELALKAERDLERGERLHAEQVISEEMLQNLRTQATVARAARSAAQFNLGFSLIRAPRDGVVLRRLAEERELVPPGQPVIVFGSAERGYVVRFALADRDIVRVAPGDRAVVRIDAFPEKEFTAVVTEVSTAADIRNGLFPVQARLDPLPADPLASGLVAKIRIDPASRRAATLTYLPIAALVEGRRDRASVFTVEGDRAKRRDVRIAFISGDSVALREGLAIGEAVITEGALYLQDGDRVRVLPAE